MHRASSVPGLGRAGGVEDPAGRRGWVRAGIARVGGGEGRGDRKGLEHGGGHGADRVVSHVVGHAVGHAVGRVVGRVADRVVGRVVGHVVGRVAIGARGVEGARGMSGCPDGCNYMASSSSLGCCGPNATGGEGTGRGMRGIALDTGAIGPGTLGLAADAAGTEVIARGSGGTGIQSVEGAIDAVDTVPGVGEAVPDTVRVEGSPDGRTAKAGSGRA